MRRKSLLFLFSLIFAPILFAQTLPQVQTIVRFVHKKTRRPITIVTPEALKVTDGGKVASAIQLRSAEELPVRYVLAFDVSGSGRSMPYPHALRAAAPRILSQIFRPSVDTVALVNFNDEVYLDISGSSDLALVQDKMRKTEMYRGGTALFEAVISTARFLDKRANGVKERRVMIIVSDGQDNASQDRLRHALATAQELGVEIYSIVLPTESNRSIGKDQMKALALETGGELFDDFTLNRVDDVCALVAAAISSAQILAYSPAEAPQKGKLRRLQIDVSDGNVEAVAPKNLAER